MLFSFIGIAAFFDYKKGRIPNKLIWLGVAVATGSILVVMDGKALVLAAIRALLVMALLYLFFMLGMLGAGDVKLCGTAVLYLNLHQSILFLAAGFLVAAIVSVGKMLFCKNFRERMCYFFSYVTEILRTGKAGLYFKEELAMADQSAVVHLAGPLLAGLLISRWFA